VLIVVILTYGFSYLAMIVRPKVLGGSSPIGSYPIGSYPPLLFSQCVIATNYIVGFYSEFFVN